MWIRKLQRVGTGVVVTIPRDVAKQWDARHIRHVVIELTEDGLVLRPLPYEELVHYPSSENESL